MSALTPLALTPARLESLPLPYAVGAGPKPARCSLVRVSLVFARRGYNIESLVVSPDVVNGDFSRMTITCRGDADSFEQISSS